MITIGNVTPENIYIYIFLLFVVDGRKLMSFYHTLPKKKKKKFSHPFTLLPLRPTSDSSKSQRRLPPWPTSKARDNSVCLV